MSDLDPLDVNTTMSRLATLYEQAGPRLGCLLVEANVLLLLADLRAKTDLMLYEPTHGDHQRLEGMQPTLAGMGMRWKLEPIIRRHPVDGRDYSMIFLESLGGYAHVSRVTSMRGVVPFDPISGWEGLNDWMHATLADLRATYEPEPILFDRWLGLLLGYPDRAVDDLCQALAHGRDYHQFAEARLPAVHRYGGALPIFRFAPEHADDPGTVATCAMWEVRLAGIYASAWHQQLVADPAFQEARRRRK